MDRRILASVAADGDHGLARLGGPLLSSHPDRLDTGVGEDTHECEISLQVPGDQLSGDTTRTVRPEHVDLDHALAFGVTEDVAAGQDQRLPLPAVDDRPGAP
jgi:hypothetical protein